MMSASVPRHKHWRRIGVRARLPLIPIPIPIYIRAYRVLCMRSIYLFELLLLLLLLHIGLYSIGADTKKYYKSIERIMYVISRCKLSNSETSKVLLERFVFGLDWLKWNGFQNEYSDIDSGIVSDVIDGEFSDGVHRWKWRSGRGIRRSSKWVWKKSKCEKFWTKSWNSLNSFSSNSFLLRRPSF